MSLSEKWKLCVGFVLVLFVYCLFPGNVDWVCDQPLLILKALEANRFNRWGELGITGGNGTVYGPVPNLLYQLLLRLTHDLLGVVLIKVALSVALIAIGLLRISADLNLKKRGVFFAFLSPLIYFYTRSLWDNVFLIPISAIYCSAVVRYLLKRKSVEFAVAVISGALLFHIHLMSVIVLIPGFAMMNVLLVKENRTRILQFVALQLAVLGASIPYLKAIFLTKTLAPYGRPEWAAILFSPLLGLRLVGYPGFFEYFSPNFFASFNGFAKAVAWILVGLSAIGSFFYLLGCRKLFFNKLFFPRQVRMFFVSVLLMTVAISVKMKLRAHPHYMNASWPVYYCIFWKWVSDAHIEVKVQKLLVVWVASMTLLLAVWITYIHTNRGDRGIHFGPTLDNQIAIAKELPKENSVMGLDYKVDNFSDFPQRLTVLAILYGRGQAIFERMQLVYAKNFPSAEIKLIPFEAQH